MSTQLIKPNYLVITPPTQHHSFFRNLSPFLVKDGLRQQIQDYWIDLEGDINVLEVKASCNALSSFFLSIRNARIDVCTDNVTFRAAWENCGCRSSLANRNLKKIEEISRAGNFFFCISDMSHRVKTLPTRPPVP